MPSVITAKNSAAQYRRGLAISAIAHILLLLVLGSSLILIPRQPIPRRAIEAFLVDENSLQQATAVKPRPVQPEPAIVKPPEEPVEELPKQDEHVAEKQRLQEEERKVAEARLEAERKEQERKTTEAKVKAEAENKRKEQKAAEAKAEADKQEQQRKAAEAKAEADARAKAEAEAKALAAKQEQARRQAELAAAMAAEEDIFAAQQSGEMDRYIALIQQKVQRNWVPPASARSGLECEVAVEQLPNGDVINARTVRCNGDAAVQRSIEAAVRRSSPLPIPDNRALFERNLRFIFKPEE